MLRWNAIVFYIKANLLEEYDTLHIQPYLFRSPYDNLNEIVFNVINENFESLEFL